MKKRTKTKIQPAKPANNKIWHLQNTTTKINKVKNYQRAYKNGLVTVACDAFYYLRELVLHLLL